MPKRGKARLDLDRIYRAAAYAERTLPLLVRKLVKDIHSGQGSMKERVAGMRLLMSLADQKPRMDDDLGLSKKQDRGSQNPILIALGNVTVTDFKSLPSEQRQRLVLSALGGDSLEAGSVLALPPSEVEVTSAEEAAA